MKTLLITTLLLGACATGKTAETDASAMSVAQNRQTCLEHMHLAEAYHQRAEHLNGGKGTYTAQVSAEQQEELARPHCAAVQHADAR